MKVSVTGDRPDTPELSALERAVLDTALAGDELAALRAQAAAAEVVSRTYSGVGFVTRFRLPPGQAAAVDGQPAVVLGRHAQLPEPAEFLLELRDGRLHTLEAYCYQGMWPADEAGFELAPRG